MPANTGVSEDRLAVRWPLSQHGRDECANSAHSGDGAMLRAQDASEREQFEAHKREHGTSARTQRRKRRGASVRGCKRTRSAI